MIFSSQSLLNIPRSNNPVIKEEYYLNEDRSFFLEALDYLVEEDKYFYSAMSKISKDDPVLNEGMSNIAKLIIKKIIKSIDIKEIVNSLVEKFKKFIEDLFNNFNAWMLNWTSSNRVIEQYKNDIRSFNTSIIFNKDHYKYTNLDTSTSYTSLKIDLDNEYSTLIRDLSNIGSFKSYDDLYDKINTIRDNISTSKEWEDELRAKIVGVDNPLTKEEYSTELFKFFRTDGIEYASGDEISPENIHSALEHYLNYKSMIKSVEKDKKDMKERSSALQSNVKQIKLENYIKDNFPQDAANIFASILQDKCFRIKTICECYVMLFSAKLDAIKESHITNTQICMQVCKDVVKAGGK